MRVYKFKNATVYITEPTEEHLNKIRKATKVFLTRVMKEKHQNEARRYNRRINVNNSVTRKREQRTKT